MSKHLDKLMQKEMTRKEFLGALGLGVLSIFGFSHIVELFTGHSINHTLTQKLEPDNVSYGGNKTNNSVTKKLAQS